MSSTRRSRTLAGPASDADVAPSGVSAPRSRSSSMTREVVIEPGNTAEDAVLEDAQATTVPTPVRSRGGGRRMNAGNMSNLVQFDNQYDASAISGRTTARSGKGSSTYSVGSVTKVVKSVGELLRRVEDLDEKTKGAALILEAVLTASTALNQGVLASYPEQPDINEQGLDTSFHVDIRDPETGGQKRVVPSSLPTKEPAVKDGVYDLATTTNAITAAHEKKLKKIAAEAAQKERDAPAIDKKAPKRLKAGKKAKMVDTPATRAANAYDKNLQKALLSYQFYTQVAALVGSNGKPRKGGDLLIEQAQLKVIADSYAVITSVLPAVTWENYLVLVVFASLSDNKVAKFIELMYVAVAMTNFAETNPGPARRIMFLQLGVVFWMEASSVYYLRRRQTTLALSRQLQADWIRNEKNGINIFGVRPEEFAYPTLGSPIKYESKKGKEPADKSVAAYIINTMVAIQAGEDSNVRQNSSAGISKSDNKLKDSLDSAAMFAQQSTGPAKEEHVARLAKAFVALMKRPYWAIQDDLTDEKNPNRAFIQGSEARRILAPLLVLPSYPDLDILITNSRKNAQFMGIHPTLIEIVITSGRV